jgi:hypothetical protein
MSGVKECAGRYRREDPDGKSKGRPKCGGGEIGAGERRREEESRLNVATEVPSTDIITQVGKLIEL